LSRSLFGQNAWVHDEGLAYGYFHTYDALQLGSDAPRKVHVLLPRSYGARRYPVVYMNDGDVVFWPGGSAHKSWRVAQTLSEMQPRLDVIIVAVCPHERNREYTHTRWSSQYDYGGASTYSDYLANDLKPFIDQAYQTDPSAAATSIVGSSHGGLSAFYTACRHPKIFGKAGVLSPSFWVGVDFDLTASNARLSESSLIHQLDNSLQEADPKPTFWIDWGLRRDGGFHNSVIEELSTKRSIEMIEILQERYGYKEGKNLFVHIDPIGGHDEDAWAYRFGLFLSIPG
jgi:pimeloyl-ACP methyl ester carboxylesterase